MRLLCECRASVASYKVRLFYRGRDKLTRAITPLRRYRHASIDGHVEEQARAFSSSYFSARFYAGFADTAEAAAIRPRSRFATATAE